jgi:hypothetical protein
VTPRMIAEILCGLVGGVVHPFLAAYRMSQRPRSQRPEWLTSRFFWICSAIMTLLAGFVVGVYQATGAHLNVLQAFYLGAGTPALLSSIVSHGPRVSPGRVL